MDPWMDSAWRLGFNDFPLQFSQRISQAILQKLTKHATTLKEVGHNVAKQPPCNRTQWAAADIKFKCIQTKLVGSKNRWK